MINPIKTQSFFLFGARGTGKSTFIQQQFAMDHPLYIDLLDAEQEDLYARNPKRLEVELNNLSVKPDWVVIDEVQKAPRLLDMVHRLIEKQGQKFVLTGSSARKLKRGAANLLAGRAFVYHLFPLLAEEQGDAFVLENVLQWGALPRALSLSSAEERRTYLRSYVLTYLKEEIQVEQAVRRLDPFREFLEVAAQTSGKILNVSNIAKDVGVDPKTIQSYFKILEETWLGFYLPSYHKSIRKSQRLHPKFFLFDLGLRNSLAGVIEANPVPGTSYYGDLFEHFLILEVFRLNQYSQQDWRLSFFLTKNDAEIDLILSKARKDILVEIKSTAKINESEVDQLRRLAVVFPDAKAVYYVSRDSKRLDLDGVKCRHWQEFLREVFK